jgi:hypothetical protein
MWGEIKIFREEFANENIPRRSLLLLITRNSTKSF